MTFCPTIKRLCSSVTFSRFTRVTWRSCQLLPVQQCGEICESDPWRVLLRGGICIWKCGRQFQRKQGLLFLSPVQGRASESGGHLREREQPFSGTFQLYWSSVAVWNFTPSGRRCCCKQARQLGARGIVSVERCASARHVYAITHHIGDWPG